MDTHKIYILLLVATLTQGDVLQSFPLQTETPPITENQPNIYGEDAMKPFVEVKEEANVPYPQVPKEEEDRKAVQPPPENTQVSPEKLTEDYRDGYCGNGQPEPVQRRPLDEIERFRPVYLPRKYLPRPYYSPQERHFHFEGGYAPSELERILPEQNYEYRRRGYTDRGADVKHRRHGFRNYRHRYTVPFDEDDIIDVFYYPRYRPRYFSLPRVDENPENPRTFTAPSHRAPGHVGYKTQGY